MKFQCEQCNKLLTVKDELAGKRAKCPGCGHVLSIPCTPMNNATPTTPTTPREEPPQKPVPLRTLIMGAIGIIAGISIIVRHLSGSTLAAQTGSTGITLFGVCFGALMLGAGIFALVKSVGAMKSVAPACQPHVPRIAVKTSGVPAASTPSMAFKRVRKWAICWSLYVFCACFVTHAIFTNAMSSGPITVVFGLAMIAFVVG